MNSNNDFFMIEWLEYCDMLNYIDQYENDMLQRQWENMEAYYNA